MRRKIDRNILNYVENKNRYVYFWGKNNCEFSAKYAFYFLELNIHMNDFFFRFHGFTAQMSASPQFSPLMNDSLPSPSFSKSLGKNRLSWLRKKNKYAGQIAIVFWENLSLSLSLGKMYVKINFKTNLFQMRMKTKRIVEPRRKPQNSTIFCLSFTTLG